MKCKRIQQYLLDYSEHVLDQENQHLVEEHLRHCAECSKELQEIEQTLHLLQTLPLQEPPETFWPDFTSNVMRQIRKMEPVPSRLSNLFFFPHAKAAVAVLLVLLVIGGGLVFYFLQTQSWRSPKWADQSSQNEKQEMIVKHPDKMSAPLDKITSDELINDMLDSKFGFFEQGQLDEVVDDLNNGNEWLYFLINNLSDEEKDRLLLELYELK